MIKEILKNILVFAVLVIGISSFSGCGGGSASNAGDQVAGGNANSGATTSTADYPPLASAVANAEFEYLDGTKFKPADLKGKVVLMNLWGIWCGPCRAEMPELIRLQDQYRDKNFEVIGLNIGRDQDTDAPESIDAIKQFAERMKLNYTLARSSRESSNQFYTVSGKSVVPQSLLIDRQGRLRGVFTGAGQSVYQSLRDTVEKVANEQ